MLPSTRASLFFLIYLCAVFTVVFFSYLKAPFYQFVTGRILQPDISGVRLWVLRFWKWLFAALCTVLESALAFIASYASLFLLFLVPIPLSPMILIGSAMFFGFILPRLCLRISNSILRVIRLPSSVRFPRWAGLVSVALVITILLSTSSGVTQAESSSGCAPDGPKFTTDLDDIDNTILQGTSAFQAGGRDNLIIAINAFNQVYQLADEQDTRKIIALKNLNCAVDVFSKLDLSASADLPGAMPSPNRIPDCALGGVYRAISSQIHQDGRDNGLQDLLLGRDAPSVAACLRYSHSQFPKAPHAKADPVLNAGYPRGPPLYYRKPQESKYVTFQTQFDTKHQQQGREIWQVILIRVNGHLQYVQLVDLNKYYETPSFDVPLPEASTYDISVTIHSVYERDDAYTYVVRTESVEHQVLDDGDTFVLFSCPRMPIVQTSLVFGKA